MSKYAGTKTEKIALLSGFVRNNGIYDNDKISLKWVRICILFEKYGFAP